MGKYKKIHPAKASQGKERWLMAGGCGGTLAANRHPHAACLLKGRREAAPVFPAIHE